MLEPTEIVVETRVFTSLEKINQGGIFFSARMVMGPSIKATPFHKVQQM